jgi:hypothetical protein
MLEARMNLLAAILGNWDHSYAMMRFSPPSVILEGTESVSHHAGTEGFPDGTGENDPGVGNALLHQHPWSATEAYVAGRTTPALI